MMVRLIYYDGTFDMVKSSRLDHMLGTGRVMKFRRSDGWVDVNNGPLRSGGGDGLYSGPERRGNG